VTAAASDCFSSNGEATCERMPEKSTGPAAEFWEIEVPANWSDLKSTGLMLADSGRTTVWAETAPMLAMVDLYLPISIVRWAI
jgi:hypothetical protein